MSSQQYYGGAIWTYHARERLGQRGLTQDMAASTFNHPETSYTGKKPGTTECIKHYGRSKVTVVCIKNDRSEWIILSCWIDPPLYGTDDYYKRKKYISYKNASLLERILMNIKSLMGL